MNTISRQAAIDAHCELCGDRNKYFCNSDICPDVEVFQLIPTIQPESKWIPCSKKLPDVDEELESADVYITYKNTYWTGVTTMNVAIARYGEKLLSSDGKYLDTPGWVGNKKYSVDDVLAWMPLPAPYKVEKRENENDRR